VVNESLAVAYKDVCEGKAKDLTTEHLLMVVKANPPLAEMDMEDVRRNTEWAEGRCWNANVSRYKKEKQKGSKRNIKLN